MDRLSALFERFTPKARVFYTGNLCQLADFDADDDIGYIHILKSGRLTVSSQRGPDMLFDEPTVMFLPRSRFHRFLPDASCGSDLVCASVDLGGRRGNPLALGLPDMILIPFHQIKELSATIGLLMDEAFSEQSARQAALDRLMEYFLILLLRHVIDSGLVTGGILAAMADPRLGLAVVAMHERPERMWSLEDLAQTAGMSRARFAGHFRDVVGRTAMDYLSFWRITVAQQMLRQGKPLKYVAPAVGYDSPAALGRVFTKIVGQSPRTWLETVRVEQELANQSSADG